MIEAIKNCNKCTLCENQTPLLDTVKSADVFWVGLSAKKTDKEDEVPLSPETNSGALILQAEKMCMGVLTYRTNLVKCVPLDDKGKLRYPSKKEANVCLPNLTVEIEELKPKIIFLLGNQVREAVGRFYSLAFEGWEDFNYSPVKKNKAYYVPIHHPSYIHVYKRKNIDDYITSLEGLVNSLI